LAKLLRERVDTLLDRSLASYVEKMPYEKIEGVRQFIKDQVVTTVQSRKTVDTALILTEGAVDHLKDRPFRELLQNSLPENSLKQGQQRLVDKLLELIRSPQARTALETILVEQSNQWLYHKPLGLLSARLPGDLRRELESGICQLVEEMLKKEAPRLVETLNVRRMVEEKVNSLDLLQVEDLLMGVMKEQFKYINLFGALLGFLIGFMNIFAFQLM